MRQIKNLIVLILVIILSSNLMNAQSAQTVVDTITIPVVEELKEVVEENIADNNTKVAIEETASEKTELELTEEKNETTNAPGAVESTKEIVEVKEIRVIAEKVVIETKEATATSELNKEMVEEVMKDKIEEEPVDDTKEMVEKEKLSSGAALHIIHNSVAGFHPVFLGHIGLRPKLDLTFYTVFWTNPSFGTLDQGNDLWLETGVGLGFKTLENKLFINPSLGITSGKFLSGGNQTLLAEGFVPSIFLLYNDKRFEFEFYAAHYTAARKGGDVTKDFLLNWIVPGVKINSKFSVGAYYEQFVLTRITEGESHSIYQWMGGYAKVNIGNGHFLRFAAGKNLYKDVGASADEFYKFSAFIALK